MFYSNPTHCNLLTIDILKQKLCLVLQQDPCSNPTLANNIGLMIWTRICLAYSNIIKILLPFTQRENQSTNHLALYTLIPVYFPVDISFGRQTTSSPSHHSGL